MRHLTTAPKGDPPLVDTVLVEAREEGLEAALSENPWSCLQTSHQVKGARTKLEAGCLWNSDSRAHK